MIKIKDKLKTLLYFVSHGRKIYLETFESSLEDDPSGNDFWRGMYRGYDEILTKIKELFKEELENETI